MDGSHVSPPENRPADRAHAQSSTTDPTTPASLQTWTQEIRRLKTALQQVLSECTAMQEELKRADLEKTVLVEKLKAMERHRTELEPLRAELNSLKDQAERDRLLIDRLQSEFRQAILERAQLHKDLFEAHAAVDQLGTLLDHVEMPPMESN